MYYRLLEIIQRSGIHSQRDKEKEMKHVLSVIFDKRHGLNLRVMMSFIQFKIKKKTPHLNLSRKDDINEKKKKKGPGSNDSDASHFQKVQVRTSCLLCQTVSQPRVKEGPHVESLDMLTQLSWDLQDWYICHVFLIDRA